MSSETQSTVQRLLLIQMDAAAAAAVATLQHLRPELALTVVEVQDDDGSTVCYRLPGEVPLTVCDNDLHTTVEWIRDQRADAVLVLTARGRSPYTWAYRSYLAGVPIRIGISEEFGGQVLSQCIAPPDDPTTDPHLYLLHACGLVAPSPTPLPSVP